MGFCFLRLEWSLKPMDITPDFKLAIEFEVSIESMSVVLGVTRVGSFIN